MSIQMKLRELRWRAAGHYTRPLDERFTEPLRGGKALEVGGPSALFRTGGLLPVYPLLTSVDGLQAQKAHVLWHGELSEGGYETGEPGIEGRLWLGEGGDLGFLDGDSYDAVISSHVLEHLANPIGALSEWLRVLRPGGHMLIVLPHKEGCADHRRATTSVDHMVRDAKAATSEDDMTHAEEVIALHDLARDPAAGGREALRERGRANPENRAMHHHCFTTRSALRLLDHVGLELLAVESRWPHDIYVLTRLPHPGERAENGRFLATDAPRALRRSPFRVDRSTSEEAG
jgi:SAM-dependent methyltransferase